MKPFPEKRFGVIVDAYSSAVLFAPEFKKRNYACIHVQSTKVIPEVYRTSFRKEDFVTNIIHNSIDKTIDQLKTYNLEFLIAGTESGVALADSLSEQLGLVTNGTAKSGARRNKYLMHETIRGDGLRSMMQVKSADITEISQWLRKTSRYPIVLKPLNSAGTDAVRICLNESDVIRAFHKMIGKKNKLGLVNDAALVQEFIQGTEFIVDTVSCCGKHIITDIWRYKKIFRNDSFLYDSIELMPARGPTQQQLGDYALEVLDALQIKNGPAHHEIIFSEEGPILVEVGARLSGGEASVVTKMCIGYGQVEAVVDAYTNPIAFSKYPERNYPLNKYALIVFFIAQQDAPSYSTPYLEKVRELPSFFRLSMNIKPGGRVSKTIDVFTSPGRIDLVHENCAILQEDYAFIRQLEKSGFYVDP